MIRILCPHSDEVGAWLGTMAHLLAARVRELEIDPSFPKSDLQVLEGEIADSVAAHSDDRDTIVFLGHGEEDRLPNSDYSAAVCDDQCGAGHYAVIAFACHSGVKLGPALVATSPDAFFLGFAERFIATLCVSPGPLAQLVADAIVARENAVELRDALDRHFRRVEDANWRSARSPQGRLTAPTIAMAAGYNRMAMRLVGNCNRPVAT